MNVLVPGFHGSKDMTSDYHMKLFGGSIFAKPAGEGKPPTVCRHSKRFANKNASNLDSSIPTPTCMSLKRMLTQSRVCQPPWLENAQRKPGDQPPVLFGQPFSYKMPRAPQATITKRSIEHR